MAHALAVGACAAPLAACGGAVASLADGERDASPFDTGPSVDGEGPEDAGLDVYRQPDEGIDVAHHDAYVPVDARPDELVPDAPDEEVPDSTPDVSGCVPLGPQQTCGPATWSCTPPGMTLGYNQQCDLACGQGSLGCEITQDEGSSFVTVECLCGGGRFPEGLELLAARRTGARAARDPVGEVLARNAALERAAVQAFERLAHELRSHRAPRGLVASVRRAARQEKVHARLLREAAAARGCRVPRAVSHEAQESAPPRSLRRIAVENAVEGCAREAVGAALLALQSRLCPDPELSPVLARIAADEAEHAELSWQLHAWLMTRLEPEVRERVLAAHERFLDRCEDEPPPESCDPHLAAALGMPSPSQWRALVRAVRWGLRGVTSALPAA